MSRLNFVIALLSCMLVAAPASAHLGVHERIAALSAQIEKNPDDATLLVARAELHITHEAFDAAERDLQRARQLDPNLDTVNLVAGMLAAARQEPRDAIARFRGYIARHPDDAQTRALRATARDEIGAHAAAAADLDVAIANDPQPKYFARRARALVAAEEPDAALAGLDEGIARLGPLVVLVELAVDIESSRGRSTQALAYIERLPDKLRLSPAWLARSGDIHASAGHRAMAREAYEQAVRALDALPNSRRTAPAMAKLDAMLQARLTELRTPDSEVCQLANPIC